MHVSGSGITR